MFDEECPHSVCRADAAGSRTGEHFRKRRATGPGVSAAAHGVERYRCIVGAVLILGPGHIGRHGGFTGLRRAAVSLRPIGSPGRDAWENRRRPGGSRSARVRNDRVRGPVERDQGYRRAVHAPVPRQRLCCCHHADRRDPVRKRARKHERHAAAIGHAVGVDPRGIDVVAGLQRIDQIGNEADIGQQARNPVHVPDLGKSAGRGVDDDETLRVRQRVPIADPHLQGGPQRCAMQADDQGCWLACVVGLGHVEQILARLARRNDRTRMPIEHFVGDQCEH